MSEIVRTVLEDGVDFEVVVTNPSIWHRLKIFPTTKTFVIFPVCLGALLKIAETINSIKSLNIELDKDKSVLEVALLSIIKNTETISKVIALAIWNRKFSDYKVKRYFQKLRLKRISRFIEANLNSAETLKIVNLLLTQMEIDQFLALMVSIKGLIILPENETEKKQASGD